MYHFRKDRAFSRIPLILAMLAAGPALLAQENTPAAASRPTFQAIRAEKAPVIDGDLDDAAWQSAPEITGFTQHDPNDGQPATQPTIVKVVYDDDAIYFAAHMKDSAPATTLLARRDNSLESDWFRIGLDPQLDRLGGAAFWVNPSNVQVDMILYNDIYEDWSWDAVWASAAKSVADGWVAEVRIPYSQLRFTKQDVHTWGINFARRTARNKEVAYLVNTPKGTNGIVSRFADLAGIQGIKPDRLFELVPYGVARADVNSQVVSADPFSQRMNQKFDGGLDVKYGLTSNLIFTGTINPDFGQVEVDPAVVNLSVFETFFPEKRPFFTEGAQMFRYGNGPANSRWGFNFSSPTFFYSRRIGRSPQGGANSDFREVPTETTILGAAKLTGKFGKGWSVGVLDALTDKENGTFESVVTTDGGRVRDRWSQQVEPMTNYFVGRMAKEYGKSSRVGMMITSVNRRLPSELEGLRENAYFGGIDGYTLFKDKSWIFEWLAGGTMVEGSAASIASTQRSSGRYYQRPDAKSFEYDPARTSLSGFGGRALLAKQAGLWRANLQAQTWSPGFELNDVGFLSRTDMTSIQGVVQYLNENVTKRFREKSFWIGRYQNSNYDGDRTADGIAGNSYFELNNYWYVFSWHGAQKERYDDRKTRGGPVVALAENYYSGLGFGSDSRKKFSTEVQHEWVEVDDGGYTRWLSVFLNYRPTSALRVSLSPSITRSRTAAQYVATRPDPGNTATYGNRYIFAQLDQKTLDMGIRTEWTASSRLSFQLFLQPFIASGDYSNYMQLARPRTREYTPYESIAFKGSENSYEVRSAEKAFTFGNPDFNVHSVKGNAVVRWEFRPGSALYLVWNENRGDVAPVGDFRMRRDFSAMAEAPSQDVFLIKFSYYLPM
jgi:hypothetical protein